MGRRAEPQPRGAGHPVLYTKLSVPTAPTCSRVPKPHRAPGAAPHPRTHVAPQRRRGLSSLLSSQAPLRSFGSPDQHQQLTLVQQRSYKGLRQPRQSVGLGYDDAVPTDSFRGGRLNSE